METIEWQEIYSVGNEQLDFQHKQMFKMLNAMIEYGETSVDSEVISEMLTKLTEYASIHINTEEQYMEQIAYPDLEIHKKEHRYFRLEISNLCLKAMQHDISTPQELLQLVSEWWTKHVLFFDMAYKSFCDNKMKVFSSDVIIPTSAV